MAQLLGNIVAAYLPANPYTQAAFAIWSNQGGTGGMSVYDHNFNCIGRFQMGGYGTSSMTSSYAPELFDSYANSNPGYTTSPVGTGGSWGTHGTNTCGYLGGIMFHIGNGFTGDITGSSWNRAPAFRDNGTIVGETDQEYAIWITSTSFTVGPRSANWYATAAQTQAQSRVTVTNKQSGYAGTTYGTCSYNASTNQMCILEANGSYGWRPTVYNNVPKLSNYKENQYYGMANQSAARNANTESNLYTYFNTSANYSTSYAAASGKPTNNGAEDNQRCVPVMCNNGRIVMVQMIPSWGFWVHRWDTNGTASGSICSQSWTTTYGVDQGTQYGIRWTCSSDGRYVLAWCASYYYGCGYYAALVRVSDGKVVYDYTTDSTYGYSFTSVGKQGFCGFRDVNADGGAGVSMQFIDSDFLMQTNNDAARVNFMRSPGNQYISSNYYSTDYPGMIPIKYDTSLFNSF